ncbi:MAG: hypothetical protein MHPSP_004351, partial [Paramarteilia canceri]
MGEKRVRCQIWDTAGEERFKSVTRAYYRGAKAIILMYDVTCSQSFDKIDALYEEIMENCPEQKSLPIALVANKTDLSTDREVTNSEGLTKAKKYQMLYHETSAKKNEGIDFMLDKLVKQCLTVYDFENIKDGSQVYINNSNSTKHVSFPNLNSEESRR